MEFCPKCGKPTEADASFCSSCGADLRPAVVAEPVKKVTGGVRGRAIASIALGGESLIIALASWYFLLLQSVCSLAFEDLPTVAAVFMYIYVFLFALIAIGCNIAGLILGNKALELFEGYRPAKIGKILNLICLLVCAAAIFIGFIVILTTI